MAYTTENYNKGIFTLLILLFGTFIDIAHLEHTVNLAQGDSGLPGNTMDH